MMFYLNFYSNLYTHIADNLVAVVDKWSLFRGSFMPQTWNTGSKDIGHSWWSIFGGGSLAQVNHDNRVKSNLK